MGDARRFLRMHRLVSVFGRLRNVAEGKLAETRSHRTRLEDEQAGLLEALGDDHLLRGLLVPMMAARMTSLSRQAAKIETEVIDQQARLRDLTAMEKSIARVSNARKTDLERKGQEADLLEIAGIFLAAKKTRLR